MKSLHNHEVRDIREYPLRKSNGIFKMQILFSGRLSYFNAFIYMYIKSWYINDSINHFL